MAERVRVWPFLIFVAILTGILYPITGSWGWGGGWLSEMGFSDFAGSTIVHSVGGWAALAGIIVLGARKGKYSASGQVQPMLGSSLPLATIGTFILWLGWFGFNGGSQLAMGSAADVVAIANIYINTNLAACGGVLTAMILSEILYKKIDLTMVLNGALAGLVSITAELRNRLLRHRVSRSSSALSVARWWSSPSHSLTSSGWMMWSARSRFTWSRAFGAHWSYRFPTMAQALERRSSASSPMASSPSSPA